ncbi:MAG: hypothetical protein C4534_08270 [Gaiellales bacterium]|nr:MAG: hypothetical protein C4534_08270 [Gaiellales bacterium]
MTTEIGAFRPGPIAPVAKPGENVLLVALNHYSLYEIAYIDTFPVSGQTIIDVGALAASFTPAGSNANSSPTLDLGAGQLGQWRFQVLDDIVVSVAQPAAARHSLRLAPSNISAFTHLMHPDDEPTEMFTFEQQLDTSIAFTVRNPRPVAIAQSRLMFYGLKYILIGDLGNGKRGTASSGSLSPLAQFTSIDEAMRSNYKFVVVPIGGWGS